MPMELRKLFFQAGELQAAAVSHCLRSRMTLPDANITGVETQDNADAMLILRFSPDNPADRDQVVLNQDEVAAALIRYCKDNQIPLPRRGQKALSAEDGGISLLVNVDWRKGGKP